MLANNKAFENSYSIAKVISVNVQARVLPATHKKEDIRNKKMRSK